MSKNSVRSVESPQEELERRRAQTKLLVETTKSLRKKLAEVEKERDKNWASYEEMRHAWSESYNELLEGEKDVMSAVMSRDRAHEKIEELLVKLNDERKRVAEVERERDQLSDSRDRWQRCCKLAIENKETVYQKVAEVEKRAEELDRSETLLIGERDEWESWCAEMATLAGCEKEWSNLHHHKECVDAALTASGEVEKRLAEVEKREAELKTLLSCVAETYCIHSCPNDGPGGAHEAICQDVQATLKKDTKHECACFQMPEDQLCVCKCHDAPKKGSKPKPPVPPRMKILKDGERPPKDYAKHKDGCPVFGTRRASDCTCA